MIVGTWKLSCQFICEHRGEKMHVKHLLMIILISNFVRESLSQCGVPDSTISRIVEGENFKRGNWPWMVALMSRATAVNQFFCGGVLVSRTKILTAAHCIQDKHRERIKTRDVWLVLGAYDLSNRHEVGAYSVAPSEIIIHPDWNPYIEKYDANIAAIIVE